MSENEKRLVAGLALASGALLVAVLLQLASAPTPRRDPEVESLRGQLQALQSDVALLKRQLASCAPPPATVRAWDGGSALEVRPEQPAPARYLRFLAPPGLAITQLESGELQVTNSDPALAGQLLSITALEADGGRAEVRVLVPPPAR